MAKIDTLEVELRANISNIQKEIDKAKTIIDKFSDKTDKANDKLGKLAKTGNSITSSFIKANIVTGALSFCIKAVVQNLDNAVNKMDSLNSFPKIMENLGIATNDSAESISYLSSKLEKLPTSIEDATNTIKRFTEVNKNVKASTEMFLALNNALIAGGAPAQIQASAIEQISQAYAKGKPDIIEWRSLMTAMPAQLSQVAQAMGYSNSNALGEALRSGKESMNDFMLTFVKLNKNGINGFASFEQQASTTLGGIGNSITVMKNTFVNGLTTILNAIGQSNITGFFNTITSVIKRTTIYIAAFAKACVLVIQSVSTLFGGKKNNTKKTVDSVNSAINNLGNSASDTSSNIDDTTTSANKLAKQLKNLASFDEMNVLSDNTGNSSNAGSDNIGTSLSALGDIEFDGWNSTSEEITEQIDKLANKFKLVARVITGLSLVNFIADIGSAIFKTKTLFDNLSSLSKLSIGITLLITGISLEYDAIKKTIQDKLSVSNFGEMIAGALGIIFGSKIIGSTICGALGSAVATGVGSIIAGLPMYFVGIWDAIKEGLNWLNSLLIPTGSTLAGAGVGAIIGSLGGPIGTGIGALIGLIVGLITDLTIWVVQNWNSVADFFKNSWNSVCKWFSNTWQGFHNFFKTSWENTCGWFGQKWNDLKSSFTAFTSNVKGKWDNFCNGIKDKWTNIVDGISTKWSSFKNGFIGIVNKMIDAVNTLIKGINKIKFNVPSWVPSIGGKSLGFNIPTIPKLARGGIVDSPTIAMIGEAGKEAVMPLENNTGWIDKLASKLSDKTNSSGETRVVVKIGEDTIVDRIIDGVNERIFRSNGEVVFSV